MKRIKKIPLRTYIFPHLVSKPFFFIFFEGAFFGGGGGGGGGWGGGGVLGGGGGGVEGFWGAGSFWLGG